MIAGLICIVLVTINYFLLILHIKDFGFDETINSDGYLAYTGYVRKRLCIVLDCLISHEFDPDSVCYISLQQYVIKEKRLKEREALIIFYNIVTVVNDLHKVKCY